MLHEAVHQGRDRPTSLGGKAGGGILRYYADTGPVRGPLLYQDAPDAIGVLESPALPRAVGMALLIGCGRRRSGGMEAQRPRCRRWHRPMGRHRPRVSAGAIMGRGPSVTPRAQVVICERAGPA